MLSGPSWVGALVFSAGSSTATSSVFSLSLFRELLLSKASVKIEQDVKTEHTISRKDSVICFYKRDELIRSHAELTVDDGALIQLRKGKPAALFHAFVV